MLQLALRVFVSKRQVVIVISGPFLLFLPLATLYGLVHMCLFVSPTLFFTTFTSVVDISVGSNHYSVFCNLIISR